MSKHFFKHKLSLTVIVIIAVVVVLGILELTNTTHLFHKKINYGSGVIPAQTSSGSSRLIPSVATDNGPTGSSAKNPAAPPSNANSGPVTPWGTFVSNHNPDLSGQRYPSQEESICNTTPGATCYITFTDGNVTKSLAAQTVDSKGAAFWTWDVKSAGFIEGDWQIKAVAALNGNTTTATDSLSLKVGP